MVRIALAPALASVPELNAVLQRPNARIADIGCGAGWSKRQVLLIALVS
jgi:hypothetical protein